MFPAIGCVGRFVSPICLVPATHECSRRTVLILLLPVVTLFASVARSGFAAFEVAAGPLLQKTARRLAR